MSNGPDGLVSRQADIRTEQEWQALLQHFGPLSEVLQDTSISSKSIFRLEDIDTSKTYIASVGVGGAKDVRDSLRRLQDFAALHAFATEWASAQRAAYGAAHACPGVTAWISTKQVKLRGGSDPLHVQIDGGFVMRDTAVIVSAKTRAQARHVMELACSLKLISRYSHLPELTLFAGKKLAGVLAFEAWPTDEKDAMMLSEEAKLHSVVLLSRNGCEYAPVTEPPATMYGLSSALGSSGVHGSHAPSAASPLPEASPAASASAQ